MIDPENTNWRSGLAANLRRKLPALLFIGVVAFSGIYLLYRGFAAEAPASGADINGDKIVNVTDLSMLLANFNSTKSTGDLNKDGRVNVTDLSLLIGSFNRSVSPAPTPPTGGSGTSKSVLITFYGSYDNDPPGALDIANPVIHQKAGGTGTYADPLTFASPAGSGQYKFGQIIYVPLVQKYFIREDECAVSWTAPDGCGPVSMVDLYIGNPSSSKTVLKCEENLTPDNNTTIIIDPPGNLPVDSKPLWDQAAGTCGNLH